MTRINLSDIQIDQLPSVALENSSDLPRIAAVYFVFDAAQEPLYVGESQSLFFRFLDHSRKADFRQQQATHIKWVCLNNSTRKERRALERALIRQFLPPLNKQCHPVYHANLYCHGSTIASAACRRMSVHIPDDPTETNKNNQTNTTNNQK